MLVDEYDVIYMEKVHYANVVGCAMYTLIYTRADVAHAISTRSRFMANPGPKH